MKSLVVILVMVAFGLGGEYAYSQPNLNDYAKPKLKEMEVEIVIMELGETGEKYIVNSLEDLVTTVRNYLMNERKIAMTIHYKRPQSVAEQAIFKYKVIRAMGAFYFFHAMEKSTIRNDIASVAMIFVRGEHSNK